MVFRWMEAALVGAGECRVTAALRAAAELLASAAPPHNGVRSPGLSWMVQVLAPSNKVPRHTVTPNRLVPDRSVTAKRTADRTAPAVSRMGRERGGDR